MDLSSALSEFDQQLKTVAPVAHHSHTTLYGFRKALAPADLRTEVDAPEVVDAASAIHWTLGVKQTLDGNACPRPWKSALRALLEDLHALKAGRLANGRRVVTETRRRWIQEHDVLSFEDRAVLSEKGDL